MTLNHPRLRAAAITATAALVAAGLSITALPTATAAPSAVGAAPDVQPAALGVPSTATVGGVTLENSFVSSEGWVKPDAGTPAQDGKYPSRLILTNTNLVPTPASVAVTAPVGTTLLSANGPGTSTVAAGGASASWTVTIPAATPTAPGTAILILEHQADTLAETPTLVWRDISTTAVLTVATVAATPATSHGPKVIPSNEIYETAKYGDRPFPIVPVQYLDRTYQTGHNGDSLESVINDPANEGSTFSLFQEMSLGQLYPDGTVPSVGIETKDFTYAPGFDFSTSAVPGNTCTGTTLAGTQALPNPVPYQGTLAYPERITDGVYNLPGQTQYYGADSNGSAVVGSLAGVGALQAIDSGCGDTGKLVYDAATIADPEIDYSDYDTDKDGVVDFFMVVFAGCGGNGSSQLSVAGCDYPDAPYDNVWPHSSSLENGYSDPVTGLPGFTTDDQLKDLEGKPLWYTDDSYTTTTTTPGTDALKVFVRVGPYNVNPETAIDFASVISHEYGHSLGLPDFYSTGDRETYGDWNLMATDKSHNIDAFGRQELGWVVPEVLDSNRVETGVTDSRQDTDAITWEDANGAPYTLQEGVDGVGRVQNSQMYVAKLPGRQLLDAEAFTPSATSEGASSSHLWWSGSGNDFGCAPQSGRNFDLKVPGLADLPTGSTAELSFKSRWDIEWDFDYGFVLTTTDAGLNYTSNPSEEGYTSSNTDPTAANPNSVACQTTYDNGLTGTSGSYQAGTEVIDRKAGNVPPAVFLTDRYDISELVGQPDGALRFSYSTDPGLARPGWFVDDVKVTATTPSGDKVLLDTDFETSYDADDPNVFNGGCREDLTTAQQCTQGWKYLQAGAEAAQDHAYYLEMRDRSGFDLDANGEADRGAPEFGAGLYLAYTDEAHGYGNVGTDDPPAQSPLDSVPEPGSATPDLNDAAFRATPADRSTFSDDSAAPHVDNYSDPTSTSGNWEFGYDCLDFTVNSMSGEEDGPQEADGDLTGDVAFTMGSGCGEFDYGYTAPPSAPNTTPTALATATPNPVAPEASVNLSAAGSTDAETPSSLDFSWDFGDGGTSKDGSGQDVTATYAAAGSYLATVTVTDPGGLVATASVTVTVSNGPPANTGPSATARATPANAATGELVSFSADGSTDAESPEALTFSWDFRDGGSTQDATGKVVTHAFNKAGSYQAKVTVTDPAGLAATASTTVLVTGPDVTGGGPGGGPGGGGTSTTTTPVKARIKMLTRKPDISRKVRLTGRKSVGAGPLTYAWNFHDGGKKVDRTGKQVRIKFKRPGRKKVTLFVTDINGQRDKVTRKFRVRGIAPLSPREGTTRTSATDDLAGWLWSW